MMTLNDPMTRFRHQHGDRPIDGYTIQRGVGRGGFGEVYHAISDAGRHVALKHITGMPDVELRGVGQVMNLKSPHLVTIFDVRRDALGDPWVIMEFVDGPSLRDILDAHPQGLGSQKAAFFLREIARGLTDLHSAGVVHRDLKPANIFFEDGYVKIGDYGLSKAIGASPMSQQTMTVGTVHYMAPEIGRGKYDRSIDIYALGALLHEMLTGRPPYDGDSAGEVLMKHLECNLDLTGIEEPFAGVICKAMHKDAAQRFSSAEAMVQAVFGESRVAESVSVFRPAELSMIADRMALRQGAAAPGAPTADNGSGSPMPNLDRPDPHTESPGDVWNRIPVSQKPSYMPFSPVPRLAGTFADYTEAAKRDSIRCPIRWALSATLVILSAALASRISDGGISGSFSVTLMVGLGGLIGGAMATRRVLPRMIGEGEWPEKIIGAACVVLGLGFGAGVAAAGVSPDKFDSLIKLVAVTAVPWFFFDLRRWTLPDRSQRVRFWRFVFLVGLFGLILAGPFGLMPPAVAVLLFGVAAAIQLASPWSRPLAVTEKAEDAYGKDPRRNPPAEPPQSASAASSLHQTQTMSPSRAQVQTQAQFMGPMPPPAPASPIAWQAAPAGRDLAVPPGVEPSHYSRFWSLMLCAVGLFGVCGLHRLYAGKIITGIIWLVTWGLFGVGQIVDAIMLLSGNAKDRWGRPITRWEHTTASPLNPASLGGERGHIGGILAAFAGLLLFVAMLVAVAAAVDVPAAINAGLPDPMMALELDASFGPGWATAARQMLVLTTAGLLLVGSLLVMLARRTQGEGHIMRGLLGVGFIGVSMLVLGKAMGGTPWDAIALHASTQPAQSMTTFLSALNVNALVAAAVVLMFGVILLAWPAATSRGVRQACMPALTARPDRPARSNPPTSGNNMKHTLAILIASFAMCSASVADITIHSPVPAPTATEATRDIRRLAAEQLADAVGRMLAVERPELARHATNLPTLTEKVLDASILASKVEPIEKPYGTLYAGTLTLDDSPRSIAAITQGVVRQLEQSRATQAMRALGLVSVILLSGGAFAVGNRLSRGYLRWRLAAASVVVASGGAMAVLWL